MIKKLLVSTVAAATLSTAVLADTYAGAGLAIESVDAYDMGFALVLNGGMTLDDAQIGDGKLAVEGEFSYSVVSPSTSGVDFTAMTLAGYAAYIFDINKELYIKPRAGLIYRSYDVSASRWGSYSNSEIGIALTVGGGYKISKEMNIFTDIALVDGMDLIHLTAGVEYHF